MKSNRRRGFNPRKVVINMACKKTSKKVASTASKVLRSKKSSKTSKTLAGTALSQRQPKHTHKKK